MKQDRRANATRDADPPEHQAAEPLRQHEDGQHPPAEIRKDEVFDVQPCKRQGNHMKDPREPGTICSHRPPGSAAGRTVIHASPAAEQ